MRFRGCATPSAVPGPISRTPSNSARRCSSSSLTFANWDLANSEHHLQAARKLVASAHAALGGHTAAPLVIDPFAGGGAIPLESLRVGASVYASDLNPVAILLNKVILEQLPKSGPSLVEEVEKWGRWMAESAEKELRGLYPTDSSVGSRLPTFGRERSIARARLRCARAVAQVRLDRETRWPPRRGETPAPP
jgi:hypothetical protein